MSVIVVDGRVDGISSILFTIWGSSFTSYSSPFGIRGTLKEGEVPTLVKLNKTGEDHCSEFKI